MKQQKEKPTNNDVIIAATEQVKKMFEKKDIKKTENIKRPYGHTK